MMSFHDIVTKVVIAALPDVELIYLFGSCASGENNQNSDIDIAVFLPDKLDGVERWQRQNEMSIALHQSVDLIDLRQASTVLQYQVVSKGICLYQNNRSADAFCNQIESMYQHLNDERRLIINRYITNE